MICYIGLGSNLGDRVANCRRAVEALAHREGIRIDRCSSLYETEPVACEGPWFVNAVAELSVGLEPDRLLSACQTIEAELGRVRSGRKNPPRPIDLDLLLYGDLVIDSPGLTVPHPRMHRRRFALIPLVELVPAYRHPVLGRTLRELLEELADRDQVRKLGPFWDFDPAETTTR